MKHFIAMLTILSFLIAACAPASTPATAVVPSANATHQPAATEMPTATAAPSETATIAPTATVTPTPSITPLPTMDPDQIQNPNFESDSGWKFVPGSEQVSGGYTDTWKSEGAKSYKIALHGDSQCRFFFEPGQRSSIVQSVDLSGVRQIYFDLNLLPPFAYSGTGIGAMRVEARIDKDVFYTFNQETGGEQLNQSILLAPGKYSGRHNLAISLMVYSNFCSYGNNQIDSNAMYVDNIRFYQDQVVVPTHTPTATPPSLSAAKDYASKLEIPVNQDGSLDLSSEDSLKTIDVVNLLAFIDQVLPNIKAMEALRRQDNPITIKSGGNLHVLDDKKTEPRVCFIVQ